ncbi:MAG: hypothetical protein WDN02_15585 [Methylovirgula sp.]|uniref:hypothetical protein n=1 Tax=Methylovirgula sp. TaxID=1978224 RepID=UPI0030761BB8
MRKNFLKFVGVTFLAAAVLAPIAAYAGHHHHFVSVEMMRHTMATMKDGTKMHVQVVKMNGHMMVMIPMADLPDYLRQQIFVPGDQ